MRDNRPENRDPNLDKRSNLMWIIGIIILICIIVFAYLNYHTPTTAPTETTVPAASTPESTTNP